MLSWDTPWSTGRRHKALRVGQGGIEKVEVKVGVTNIVACPEYEPVLYDRWRHHYNRMFLIWTSTIMNGDNLFKLNKSDLWFLSFWLFYL